MKTKAYERLLVFFQDPLQVSVVRLREIPLIMFTGLTVPNHKRYPRSEKRKSHTPLYDLVMKSLIEGLSPDIIAGCLKHELGSLKCVLVMKRFTNGY